MSRAEVPDAATLVERFRRARKDPALAVLEGFHCLKHALRFGAAIDAAVTPDPAALVRLASELAPDIVARLGTLAAPVTPELFARLAPSRAIGERAGPSGGLIRPA